MSDWAPFECLLFSDSLSVTQSGLDCPACFSEISWTGDDFLNIHNRMLVVCQALGASRTIDGATGGAGAGAGVDASSLAIVDVGGGNLADAEGDEIKFYALVAGHVVVANPFLGSGVVRATKRVTDPAVLAECQGITAAMKAPPYSADLVVNVDHYPLYRVDFAAPLHPNVTAPRYSLGNSQRRSCAGAVVRRNHFHDACGSGGRIIAKARDGTYADNLAERYGGFHVYAEPEWLEGDLGLRNVALRNNTFVDGSGPPEHVDVMKGLANVTCENTTFVTGGHVATRAVGC